MLEKVKNMLLAAIVIVCVIFITIFIIGNRKEKSLSSELSVIRQAAQINNAVSNNTDSQESFTSSVLPGMEPLIDRNSDTVGWINIEPLEIDYAVVQAADNETYLTKDFDKNYSEAGSIFADQYCVINPEIQCDNIVLYGHNQMNGSMFGSLTKYKKNPMFVKDSPVIRFNTNYKEYEFKIFAFYVINTDESHDDEPLYRYHTFTSFNDDTTYDQFIYETTRRSLISTDIDTSEDDLYITLSTCAVDFNDARFVVVGRAVRDEEDREREHEYKINNNAYFPDIYHELGCSNFAY